MRPDGGHRIATSRKNRGTSCEIGRLAVRANVDRLMRAGRFSLPLG